MHFTDQTTALDSAVVKTKECLARTEVMQWINADNLIKLTIYDETKKRQHESLDQGHHWVWSLQHRRAFKEVT